MPSRLKIARRAALAAAFVLSWPGLVRATKLNPRLRAQRGYARRGAVMRASAMRAASREAEATYRVLVQVAPGTTLAELHASYPKARFRTMVGSVVTATVLDSVLDAFEGDARIVRVEAVRKLHPVMDVARSNSATGGGLYLGVTRNAASADLANATGAGVIVGIVDTGIDFKHKDFIKPGTNTSRVLRLWDQTDHGGGTPPNFSSLGFSCSNSGGGSDDDCGSSEWTQAQMTADITNGTSVVKSSDTVGHGTHVAGIAAGNGNATGALTGMAPQSDIIFVKTGFFNDEILDGLQYISAYANQLHERAVINLSLGTQIDPHDGTSLFDVGVAAIAQSTPVVVCMGNDGAAATAGFSAHATNSHAQTSSLAFNSSVAFGVNATGTAGYTEFDFWSGSPSSASNDTYSVSVALGATNCGTAANGGNFGGGVSCGGNTVFLFNDDSNVGFSGGDTNTSNDREIFGFVDSAYAGTITVTVTCKNPSGCGRLDGFVYPEQQGANFNSGGYATPATLTMWSPATANDAFSIGSYATKSTWVAANGRTYQYDASTLGNISQFSSWGPTRDGRNAPDVAAPGDVIASAFSSKAVTGPGNVFETDTTFDQLLPDGVHAILAGTSMATPVVTGILATRLQGAPNRTVAQLRSILQGLARSDAGVTSSSYYGLSASLVNNGWNDAFGAGKVVASPQPLSAPTGLAAVSAGSTTINWSWSPTTLSADAYDVYYATQTGQSLALGVQSYTQTNLIGNAVYGIQVRGEGGGIDGPGATITTATYAAPPTATPSAAAYVSSATIFYSPCTAAPDPLSCSGYEVQASTAANFSGTTYSNLTTTPTVTQLSLTGLPLTTNLYVRLGALNPLGAITWGSASGFFSTGASLLPPASPSFTSISTGSLVFNWSLGGNSPGLTYLAQASTAANFSGTLQSQTVTALSAAFGGLSADTSYYFQVQAVGGPFLQDSTPAVTLPVAPAVSTTPFLGVGTTALTAAWTNAGDALDTLYQADVSPVSNFSSGVISVQARSPVAVFSGLTANTLYYARVAAIGRAGGMTAEVPLGSTTTLAAAPTLPGQPFSAQTTGGFVFSFNSAGNSAGTRYSVLVSTDPGFSVAAASSNTAAASASFAGLFSNQLYYAEVAALNQAGAPTAFTAASTYTAVAAPAAVAVPVTTQTAGGFGFAWGAGTLAPGTSYVAQASSSPAFAFGATSSATANAFAIFSGLQPNTTYYGQVQAQSLSSNPNGPFLSAATVATPPNPPTAAAASFLSISYSSMTVAWKALPLTPSSAAAEGYLLQVSTASDFSAVAASSAVAPGVSSAAVTGLSAATLYYARVGAIGWEGGASYLALGSTTTMAVPLSSGTVTVSGLSLAMPPAFPQLTAVDVVVPPGAFPVGTSVSVGANLGALPNAVTNEAAAIVPFGATVGLNLSAQGLQPATPVRLTLAYDPTRIPLGQSESKLQLWRYDPVAAQWTLVPSQDDPVGHLLTAYTPHFSLFAPFFTSAGTDVSAVQVFPQPWEIGAPSSQYWASVLTFSGLPSGTTVKIFTVTGELVWSGTAAASGTLDWDGSTRFGRKAASGTYYAAFQSGGQTKTRRLVIIR